MVKRARKAKPPSPAVAPPRKRVVGVVFTILFTLAVASALIWSVSRLGDEARRNIGPRDRYALQFSDIRCDAPPGQKRETFLAEVQYASNAASTMQLMDPDLQSKLTAAFSAHPWVASVDAVNIDPPDAVSVKLTFRTAVLAVPAEEGKRVVDAKGILLPASASIEGLPELLTPVKPPGKAGQPWPDDLVIRAASVAAEYKPKTIERASQGWELIQRDGRKLTVGR